ncbi:ribbon-helix-helix domain-containing protein [Leifsonia sp. 2MCAF36]|uniref:ribbon-helix-helix domain-containing protein n=1 Tax=Leifsonia sp. 2MCAF36 TaxID=3232988 RepID=UPI003F9EA8EF
MSTNYPDAGSRIVKIPLPVALIRDMDEKINAGLGGFRTRAELVQEAVENLLNELVHPAAPDSLAEPVRSEPLPPSRLAEDLLAGLPEWEREEVEVRDLAGTALFAPSRAPVISGDGVVSRPEGPLLGFHNRDYVSIWALHRLARYTQDGPIPFDEYLRRATRAAWLFGAGLQRAPLTDGFSKLTILFPTNVNKQPSAERGFQAFAIGSIGAPQQDNTISTSGPLFAWQALDIRRGADQATSLTQRGWDLVKGLSGINLSLPHSEDLMVTFLTYLETWAPGDMWGFRQILSVAAEAPDREQVVATFAAANPSWSRTTASSIAQGYIARAREWGLIEPKLVDGRYWLTARGRSQKERTSNEATSIFNESEQ